MSSGFNTDVQVGDRVFHVQTEDRGPPILDRYNGVSKRKGRPATSIELRPLCGISEFNADELRERVEEQHRALIEDLRSGVLDEEIAATAKEEDGQGGIQVQLLNPESWLSAGNVSLDLEILRRADGQPEAGAHVKPPSKARCRTGGTWERATAKAGRGSNSRCRSWGRAIWRS